MSKILRNLLLATGIGLSMPSVMAQTESFTGLSNDSYLVDYANGLVTLLRGDNATVVSPQEVVDGEFFPIWDNIVYLATKHDVTAAAFDVDRENFLALTDAWELQDQAYQLSTSNFLQMASTLQEHYLNLFNIIEQILQMNAASKPSKTMAAEEGEGNGYPFNIAATIADYRYAEFLVGFTREYLEDFEAEIADFAEKLEESAEEIDEITLDYDHIINYHYSYIEGLYAWLNESAEYADDDTLYEIAVEIQTRSNMLTDQVVYRPDNPAEYLTTWAETCLDYMNSTYENFAEAYEELVNVTEKITVLRRDFAGVMYDCLYNGYHSHDDQLTLPPFVSYDGNDYTVSEVMGNIFAGKPADVAANCNKLVLPATISGIYNQAFAIDGIQNVTVYSPSVPILYDDCFTEDTYSNAVLYVKDDLVEEYRNTYPWSEFKTILPESASAVKEVTDVNSEVRVEGNILVVKTKDDAVVHVYSADGKTIFAGCSNRIELPAKGLYIVRAAGKTFKIRY